MSYISNLPPQRFEDFCRRLLQAQGFKDIKAEFPITADIRVDFWAQSVKGEQAVIEIKQTRDVASINSMLFQVSSYQKLASAQKAILIISEKAPKKTSELSAGLNVEIWDEDFIQKVVQQYPNLFGPPKAEKIRPGEIRLESVHLINFRGVSDLSLNLSPVTVLVGKNGAGKSTVLDALAIALSWFCRRMISSSANGMQIAEADIRITKAEALIQLTAEIEGDVVVWDVVASRSGHLQSQRSKYRKLTQKIAAIQESYVAADRPLSVIVYYSVHRAVQVVPVDDTTLDESNRLRELYRDAIGGDRQDFKGFFEWFRKREDLENEKRLEQPEYRDVQIDTVRAAILKILNEFSDLRIERSAEASRMVAKKGDYVLDINQLSDGEKCVLGMIGDLARRLAIANPSAINPLDGFGVVLIDEIELHLHPQLQRNIISFLTLAFPNCQFIISTHSAPIVSHSKHPIILMKSTPDGIQINSQKTYGRDANQLFNETFGAPTRPSEIQEQFDLVASHLDRDEINQARIILDGLKKTVGEDDLEVLHLNSLISFLEA